MRASHCALLERGVGNADAGTNAVRELVGAADSLVGWTDTRCAAAFVDAGTANIPVDVAAGTRSEGAGAKLGAVAGTNAATLGDAGTANIPVDVAAGTRSERAEAKLDAVAGTCAAAIVDAGTANIHAGVAAGTRSEEAEAALGLAEVASRVPAVTAPPA